MEHLGRPHRRAGIADQRMRHRADAFFPAKEMRRRVGGAADKADGTRLAPRRLRADRGGVGHHVGHIGPGAVPGIHREKGDLGQFGAHRIGVVGGDASRPELLQQHRLEIDEVRQRAGHIEDRLAGADQRPFRVVQLDVEAGAAVGGDSFEKLDRQARRRDHRAAHEHRIGRLAIAEPLDDRLRLQEIAVGPRRERWRSVSRHRRRLTRPRRAGRGSARRCSGVRASARRRSRTPIPAPGSR